MAINDRLTRDLRPAARLPRPEIDLLRQRIVRHAAYAALIALAGVLLLLAVAIVPVLFGYHTYIVTGSSMEPTLANGSVAVTHPTSDRGLNEGDIIAFQSSPGAPSVLHRIVAIKEVDGRRAFVTQGDANAEPDANGVTLSGAGDKLVYSVPYAGYVLSFANSVLGRIVLIGMPGCSLVLMCARTVRRNVATLKPKPEPGPSSFPPPPASVPPPPLLAGPAQRPRPLAPQRIARRPPLKFAPALPIDVASVRASRLSRATPEPVELPVFVRMQVLGYHDEREHVAA